MSLLSYNELCELVEKGVITADINNVNGASIDITLHDILLLEDDRSKVIDLANKDTLPLLEYNMKELGPKDMYPGEFLLGSSNEVFNLPDNIACEYKLKSSLARCGLQHMLAGWCDPCWQNSKLTLELKNDTLFNRLKLRSGMKIGQMVFFSCKIVPHENSYAVKGQYQNQHKATGSKGLR